MAQMKTKSEIQAKLKEAEEKIKTTTGPERERIGAVIITLRWVLGVEIRTAPIDPVIDKAL
jgi:hypothetical protein